jgi:MazG nucleotide pyrophosphohydrolase domain
MTTIKKASEMTLDGFQSACLRTAIYPGNGMTAGLIYSTIKGAGESGEFPEKIGKAMRDDALIEVLPGVNADGKTVILMGEPTLERRAALALELFDELWYICARARDLKIDLSDIAQSGLDKLASRAERGTLKGSGDNR